MRLSNFSVSLQGLMSPNFPESPPASPAHTARTSTLQRLVPWSPSFPPTPQRGQAAQQAGVLLRPGSREGLPTSTSTTSTSTSITGALATSTRITATGSSTSSSRSSSYSPEFRAYYDFQDTDCDRLIPSAAHIETTPREESGGNHHHHRLGHRPDWLRPNQRVPRDSSVTRGVASPAPGGPEARHGGEGPQSRQRYRHENKAEAGGQEYHEQYYEQYRQQQQQQQQNRTRQLAPLRKASPTPAPFPRPRHPGHGRAAPIVSEGISSRDRDRRRGGGRDRDKDKERDRDRERTRERSTGTAPRMSSSGGGAATASAADKRRSLHGSRTNPGTGSNNAAGASGSRGRSNSVNRNALIAPPPKAFHSGPASSSPSGSAEDGHGLGLGPDAGTAGTGKENNASGPAPTTAAGLAASLKEKDDKIAMLQTELRVMEEEFAKELDRLSQNESETATFWQKKHSALNQQYLRADTELRLLTAEVEVRRDEREELREGWDILRKQVREREAEIASLMSQVRGLKDWVSTSTRSDAQTTDEVFGDGMAKLANGLQNWVIVNFRKAKLDLTKASVEELESLSKLVPMYEELAAFAKVHLLQSLISGILVETVFSAYFVGLSEEQTEQFRQVEKLLRSFTDTDGPINQWRSSTLSILRRDDSKNLSAETESLSAAVMGRIISTLRSITAEGPTTPRPGPDDPALAALVRSSVDLARLLAVQKAEFRVWMPPLVAHQRTTFDEVTMEDLGGGEDEEGGLAAREVWCVAFPGIIKRGDETGGHLQYENVVAKARVLCKPDE